MIGIAWRMLRRQTGTLLGAVVMAVVGATLITSFMLIQVSVNTAQAPVERYREADVVVAGTAGNPGAITPALAAEAASIPGVDRVVPEVTFPAQVLRPSQEPLFSQQEIAQFGHAWTSASLGGFDLVHGVAPTSPGEVALDEALATDVGVTVGDRVPVAIGGILHDLRVTGMVAPKQGSFSHQRNVFLTPEQAHTVAARGHGRVDALGVLLQPGQDPATIAAALDQAVVKALAANVPSPTGTPTIRVAWGDERGELEGTMPDHRASGQVMIALVWIVSFMATAVIGGALVSSVRRRAGQFALLRAIGATPGQIRTLCQAEALLIGLLAAVLGGPLGVLLASGLLRIFHALDVVSPVVSMRLDATPLLVGAVIVLVVSQVAAWFTARSALRIRPGDALGGHDTSAGQRRSGRLWTAAGVVAVLSAGGLQAAGMAGAVPVALMASYGTLASLLVMVGVGLLGSPIIHRIAILVRRPVGWASPTGGFLAAANVRHHYRRYAGVAAPLAVGLAIAGWALSGLPLYAQLNANAVSDRLAGEYVATTPIVRGVHTGLAPQALTAIANVPGVSSVAGVRETWMQINISAAVEPSSITRGTVTTGPASALLGLGQTRGDLGRVDAGRGVALSETYAGQRNVSMGDEVAIWLQGASAPTRLPVVALYGDDSSGQQGVLVAQSALAAGNATQWSDYLLIDAQDSLTLDQLAVPMALGTVSVESHADFVTSYVEQRIAVTDNLGTIATALAGVFLIVAAITALALSAADRAADLVALQRLNATNAQIRSMVSWEMVLTVGPAWLLGALATLWMALAMAGGKVDSALWAYPVGPLVSIGLIALALAVLGSLLATRASRRNAGSGGTGAGRG